MSLDTLTETGSNAEALPTVKTRPRRRRRIALVVATFALVASGITWWAGNYQEWWSLDPDGDGTRDGDARIVRVLRGEGWSDKGVAVVDIDGDYGVDRIE
ncbi:MAG TPA: hypothetical protein VEB69_01880 [Acidimicrobiia bacterium]|nr:hypothetical protein [Acidimicrobiia bacterium]